MILQIYGGVLPAYTNFTQILVAEKDLDLKAFKMAMINEEKRRKDASNMKNDEQFKPADEVYFAKEQKQKNKNKNLNLI